MKSLQINCDMGEGTFANPRDIEILPYVDAINIALGAHAGDKRTAQDLAQRAADVGVVAHLHPSYPDRAGFGRRVLDISPEDLIRSLDEQRAILPESYGCKFHGALYNQALIDESLAECLVSWMLSRDIKSLVSMSGCVTKQAKAGGLKVISEGFIDRGYCLHQGSLALEPRSSPKAHLTSIDEIKRRVNDLLLGQVHLVDGSLYELAVDTVCVHGDGPLALPIAQAARGVIG